MTGQDVGELALVFCFAVGVRMGLMGLAWVIVRFAWWMASLTRRWWA